MAFQKDFFWAAATASYQIEGAWNEDGKGLSVWDMTARIPGKIHDGHTGQIACDHYHRYRDDVKLMKKIRLNAYRFSISWPRVLPAGTGAVDTRGLDFYSRLVDALLEANITPLITLFHWDYPYELFCRGGWLNPDSPRWFADYVRTVVDALSDRVTYWLTLNEPQCFMAHHPQDNKALCMSYGWGEMLRMMHHVLLAHGLAVQSIRAQAKTPSKVGWAPVGHSHIPITEKTADIEAARQALFAVDSKTTHTITWWMDPVYLGRYPEDGLRLYAQDLPEIKQDDLKTISQPLDFFGINIYSGNYGHADADGRFVTERQDIGHPLNGQGPEWNMAPDALYWGPRFYYERYHLPILITENGTSMPDWIGCDGTVNDGARIDFITRYLRALHRAHTDGVPVLGYCYWSLMDNFEWFFGYRPRFGLIYTDYATQQRTLKNSAYWYRDIIKSNGDALFARSRKPALPV